MITFDKKYLEGLIEYINEQTKGIKAGEVPFNEFLIKARDTGIHAISCNKEIEIPIFDFKYKIIRMFKINETHPIFSYLIRFDSNKRLLHKYAVILIYGIGFTLLDQLYVSNFFPIICEQEVNDDIEEILLKNITQMYD